MKTLAATLVLLALSGCAPAMAGVCDPYLVAAIAKVEGNPTGRYCDDGRSVGPLCVTAKCVADVNRLHGTRYRWPEDMKDYAKAADVFLKYTSRCRTDADRAAMWNKGWRGKDKRSASRYAAKVMRIYSESLNMALKGTQR